MTGSGLKDFEALKTWNEKPDIKNVDEWKSFLIH